jgi:hypothetical protein
MEQKKKARRERDISVCVFVTAEERSMIEQRMAQTGISSLRAYITKMAIDGRVIHIETAGVKEMIALLTKANESLNEIAKRVNMSESIYSEDIDNLRSDYEKLWGQTREILKKLGEMTR